MDETVTPAPPRTAEAPPPLPHAGKSLARIQAVPWLLAIVLFAAVVWLAWRAFLYRPDADPVASSLLAFQKQNSLIVFSSRFEVVAESDDARLLGLLKSKQAAVIPASVTYRVDLSAMDRDRFTWNASAKTLDVVLPPLKVSKPNLDEANMRLFTEGSWVTAGAQRDLSRNNSQQAERKAAAFAQNPEIIALARQAAREAIRQNLAVPLDAAGYRNAIVNVRFDGEAAPAS